MLIFSHVVCTKKFRRRDLGNCQRRSFYCIKTWSAHGISDENNIVNHESSSPYSFELDPDGCHLFRPMEIHLTEQKLQLDGGIKCNVLH
jgi:hypothetical protein